MSFTENLSTEASTRRKELAEFLSEVNYDNDQGNRVYDQRNEKLNGMLKGLLKLHKLDVGKIEAASLRMLIQYLGISSCRETL